ncbi:MAG: pyrroline-5-carboxylate reductase [Oscillospiraceae bacterium]|nr:pyrroline-5-carboxylate reductase [Oscillospiraceae bacterium]
MRTIGFIGTGNMAMSIISGIYNNKVGMRIMSYDINNNNCEKLNNMGAIICKSSAEVVKKCEFIILAIKPQNFPEVLNEIKSSISEKNVIVSIAAGITEKYIQKIIGFVPRFIQIMPNTPLLIGKGATAIARGSKVDDEDFLFVKKIFSINGKTCVINIDKMNEIIPINGSSPAFIYMFAQGFLDFAKSKGIDEHIALNLFCATLNGSAQMLLNSGKSPDELIKDVSSPGGTTIAGLSVLKENDFIDIIKKTCEETTKRAYELTK